LLTAVERNLDVDQMPIVSATPQQLRRLLAMFGIETQRVSGLIR
jgi:hypothetical protein